MYEYDISSESYLVYHDSNYLSPRQRLDPGSQHLPKGRGEDMEPPWTLTTSGCCNFCFTFLDTLFQSNVSQKSMMVHATFRVSKKGIGLAEITPMPGNTKGSMLLSQHVWQKKGRQMNVIMIHDPQGIDDIRSRVTTSNRTNFRLESCRTKLLISESHAAVQYLASCLRPSSLSAHQFETEEINISNTSRTTAKEGKSINCPIIPLPIQWVTSNGSTQHPLSKMGCVRHWL